MRLISISLLITTSLLLGACTEITTERTPMNASDRFYDSSVYASRIPQHIDTLHEKAIVVDPNVHVWGAYDKQGSLVRAGIATAGGDWCEDNNRPCRTAVGTFRIQRMAGWECASTIYPKPHGGGLMPYCMFFHDDQALHGSPDEAIVENNISHGCVRVRIPDAEWIQTQFASKGTKVIIKPYQEEPITQE